MAVRLVVFLLVGCTFGGKLVIGYGESPDWRFWRGKGKKIQLVV